MTRRGLLAFGYQGFGNLGDEAILAGIEALLADAEVGVAAVACGPGEIPAFPHARRVRTRGLLPTMGALRELRRRRGLLLAGGGLLHDHWPRVVPSYLAWSVIARLAGARVAWLGVGVGPLRRGWSRWLAGRTLRLATLVTVRDEASAALVREVAPGVEVSVVPDPAVFNARPPAAARRGVGVIVRGPAPAERDTVDDLAARLGGVVAALAAAGPVAILTMAASADASFAARVAAASAAAGADVAVESLPIRPAAALARLAAFEALLSVRLHGVILGAVAGTPVVGVAYDAKVRAWCARLASPAIEPADLDELAARAALATAMAPAARAAVAEQLAGLQAERAAVRDRIVAALG